MSREYDQLSLETTTVSGAPKRALDDYGERKEGNLKRRKVWSKEELEKFHSLCKYSTVSDAVRIWNSTHEKRMTMTTVFSLRDRDPTVQRGRPFSTYRL